MMTRNEIEQAVPVQNLLELLSDLRLEVGLSVDEALAHAAQAVVDELVLNQGQEKNVALQLVAAQYVIRSYQAAADSAAVHGMSV